MAWNGSGAFSRTNGVNTGSTTWTQDRDAGTKITSARHDTHDQDLSDGINACIAKNGENYMTGAFDLNGQVIELDADADTKIGATADDRIDITVGNSITERIGHDSTNSSAFHLVAPAALTAQANTAYAHVNVAPAGAVTVPSGTTAVVASLELNEPNITATGTVTAASTLYIAAAPTEGSSNYALWVDAGNVKFDADLTLGAGAATDVKLVYDGNAKDFYIGLDDSADKFVVGVGSTVGTNSIMTLDDDAVTIGDGAAVDTKIVFDGNAQDYYIGLDDSADDLVIGLGSTVGTTPAISIDENQMTTFGKAALGATLTDTSNTGSITLDFNAYQNFILTFTGNVTLANPTTESVGQSGFIVIIQDGTGSRTLSLGTDYETAGGSGLTISTAANAVDVVPYIVKAAGSIQLGAPQLAFA
tara:strand:+ start:5949 stop:7202 length:1254 start_codon:yes stop_codon:yes gene_type:complete